MRFLVSGISRGKGQQNLSRKSSQKKTKIFEKGVVKETFLRRIRSSIDETLSSKSESQSNRYKPVALFLLGRNKGFLETETLDTLGLRFHTENISVRGFSRRKVPRTLFNNLETRNMCGYLFDWIPKIIQQQVTNNLLRCRALRK